MTKIEFIFFDLGGVLVRWQNSWLLHEISKKFGLSEEKLTKEFENSVQDFSSGKIQEIKFWRLIGKRIHSSELQNLKRSLFYSIFKKRAKPNHSVLSLSKKLKKKGFGIGILSNTEPATYSIIEEWKLIDHFDYTFLSYKIGLSKPDRKIYEYVLEKLPFKKDQVLFIDDTLDNVKSAKAVGIRTLQYSTLNKLLEDLNRIHIL